MKKIIGIISVIAGSAMAIVQFGQLLWNYDVFPWMTSGLSGLLIFMGIIVLSQDYRSRNRTIEDRHY